MNDMKCKAFCIVKDFISKNSKIVITSIVVNIAWIVVMNIIYADHLDGIDFGIYYTISADWAKNGFANTYNEAYWHEQELMPWRYFPFFLMIFSIITTLPMPIAYTAWMMIEIASLIICVACMWKMMEIMQCTPTKKAGILMMGFLLMWLPIDCLNIGNVGIIIGCLGMVSLYCFIVKKEAIGCILIGLSIMIKPVLIVIAILLILSLGKKEMVKRSIFVSAFLVPDVIIFLFHQEMLHDFISVNFTNDPFYGCFRLGSISFMNIIALFNDSTFLPQVIALACCVVYGLVIFSKMQTRDEKYLSIFAIGSFAYLIIFPDVWTSQLMFIFPFWFMYIQKEMKGSKQMYINLSVYVALLYVKGNMLYFFYFIGSIPDFGEWSLSLIYIEPSVLIIIVIGLIISVLTMIEFLTFALPLIKKAMHSSLGSMKNS